MPQVRLDRPERAAALAHAVDLCQAGEFDRVPDGCPRPVCLDHPHLAGIGSGPRERLPEQRLLSVDRGRGQAVGAPVLVDRRAAHHRQDAVAVAQRVGEALEDDGAAALAAYEAVGRGVEGAAASGGGEHPHPEEGPRRPRSQHERDAAGEGEIALPVAQGLACQVERHQGGRTGGVQGDAGPVQAQQVGDAAGGDAVPVRQDGALQLPGVPGEGLHVVGVAQTREQPCRGPEEAVRRDSGMLQRFPGHLQQ